MRRFDLRALVEQLEPCQLDLALRRMSGDRLQVAIGNRIIVEGQTDAILELLRGGDDDAAARSAR